MKKFNAQKFVAIQRIVGKRLIDVFQQLDFFVLNFGEEGVEYSIHTYVPPRISYGFKILLTGTDEYYDKDYQLLSEEAYENDELHTQSLFFVGRQKTKELLKTATIKEVEVSRFADIKILFDNGARIDIFPNATSLNCEHYSFFKCKDYTFPHYVIRQKKDTLFLETISIEKE